MQNHWRKILSILPGRIERSFYKRYFKKEHISLEHDNPSGFASNFTKQKNLQEIAANYQLKTLVETGTYLGDTLYALYNHFDQLYSIELSDHYFEKASRRFQNYPKIKLMHGDSGKVLFDLVPSLKTPALFWLDGHYSAGLTAKGDKECPIFEELTAIFQSDIPHVIIIDDARCFVGKNDYPAIDELKRFVLQYRPRYTIIVIADSIRLMPQV